MHTVKKWLKQACWKAGFEIRRRPATPSVAERPAPPRMSLEGALQQVKQQGWQPGTVIDVGAAYGAFTATCRTFFPDAKYLLCEPLAEYQPFLARLMAELRDAEYIPAAISAHSGEITIHVHPDFVGSSLYLEREDSDVNGVPRVVPTMRLDDVLTKTPCPPPVLLKLDVQGAEREALLGATSLLPQIDVMMLEVSFFEFFKDAPQICEMIAFLKQRGFVPYDLFGVQYRPLDQALSQVDLLFVKDDGLFRRHHFYATREQRAWQNQFLQRNMTG